MKQIYFDSDDEITAIINKLESVDPGRVALIPPKRSTVLQSVVNLKLLKKAAEAVEGELVLITRDPVILNVASQLKILTAPNLETEPAVPEPKTSRQEIPSAVIDGSQASEKDFKSADKAAGDLDKDPQPKKTIKDKKGKKVPDFNRFKKYILIGLLALFVIGGGLWAALVWAPNAVVSIEGRTQEVSADIDFRLDPNLEESNLEERILAAELSQESRTFSATFDATGTETVGERATGQVTVTNNCYETSSNTPVGEGTRFTADNGRVFRNNVAFDIPPAAVVGGVCSSSSIDVAVTADDIGEEYNINPTSYTVGDFPRGANGIDGNGGNMSGGSSEEVTVVTAADITRARDNLVENERESMQETLSGRFDQDSYIIEASFIEDVEDVVSEPEAGGQANEARLIIQVSYSLLAVHQEDIEVLLAETYKQQAEGGEEMGVIRDGLEEAEITRSGNNLEFTIAARGILGPDIVGDDLKEEIAGESYRGAIDIIEAKPNVTRVQIDLSPFWVASVPKNPNKITVEFELDDPDEANDDENGDDTSD